MDVSYAQNLEDYVLWRALGDKRDGFYIDVGGGHPVADNVSCWFYLAGWRGIVVEPQANLADLYAHVRPRDRVFRGVAGDVTGDVEFHAVDRLHGMSSLDPRAASAAARFGASHRTVRAPMTTLDHLIASEGARAIDFLKIDVEGAEALVLRGLDLVRHRPAALCIEAVAPGDMAENWSGWEPHLLASGYEFMLFDGLNRYYAAREAREVAARFPREKPEWGVVPTFGLWERAPTRADHPDHDLARRLTWNFLAALPRLDRTVLAGLLTGDAAAAQDAPATQEARRAVLESLLPGAAFVSVRASLARIEAPTIGAFRARVMDSDAFRIVLARIAMSYDGGQIVEGETI